MRRLLLWRDPGRGRETGQVLLVIIVIMLAVTVSSSSFIWFMNQQQTRAGNRYRALAALHVADSGVQRTLAILETTSPEGGPGREWRPVAYTETVNIDPLKGRFTVSVESAPGGTLVITSDGQVSAVVRRLRVRAHLASPALLAALYGASSVRFERPPAFTFIGPYGELEGRPWIHIEAGKEVWFADTGVAINDPSIAPGTFPGPIALLPRMDRPEGGARFGPVRILLAKQAELTLGPKHERVDSQQLRVSGFLLENAVRRIEPLPRLPEVDRDFYRSLAAGNRANAEINHAAGRFTGDRELEEKQDSLYLPPQMAKLLTYLVSRNQPMSLRGVIYVAGAVTLPTGSQLHVTDGALLAENTVKLEPQAELSVIHTPRTRTLPGIIVLDHGGLVVGKNARLRVHGLVYTQQTVETAEGASVEVVGALASNDPGISFRGGAAIVIRYDPAVLGTPGLRVAPGDPVIAWVSEWQEVRQ